MQITETVNEGLKRELRIVVPADELDTRLNDRLFDLKNRVRLRGFRPGKVPVNHLRRVYGRSVMAELVQETVSESSQKAIEDREERPAQQPDIKLTEDEQEIEAVLKCEADLAFTVAFEVLPQFDPPDFSKIELVREVAEVGDADIQEAIGRIAEQSKPFEPRGEGEGAENGDRVTMDYVGRIDGEAFDGGSEEDGQIVIGSGGFLPGFEEQLVGAKTGESRTVSVTFPEDYPAAHLAGKDAEFEVTVKEAARPGEAKIDDALAESLGFESLDKLQEVVRQQMERDFAARSREKVKRQLLDKLDELYSFELPQAVLEREFDGIWSQVTDDLERRGKTFEDEGTSEEAARADYRRIAERRVRLGLVLADVGEKNEIKVTEDELNRGLSEQMRRFPGQEQELLKFYRENPGALAQLRAPIFEEKVVDYVLELAQVTEKQVSREELLTDPDDDDHVHHDHDHAHDHGDDAGKTTDEKPSGD